MGNIHAGLKIPLADKSGFRVSLEVYYDDTYNPRVDSDCLSTIITWHRRYDLGYEADDKYESPVLFLRSMVKERCSTDQIIGYLLSGKGSVKVEECECEDGAYNLYWFGRESVFEERKWNYDDTILLSRDELDAIIDEYLSMHDCVVLLREGVFIAPLYLHDHSGLSISMCDHGDRWDSGFVGFVYITKEDAMKSLMCGESEWRHLAEKCCTWEIKEYDSYLRGDVYGYKITDRNGMEIDSCWGFVGDDMNTNGMMNNVTAAYKVLWGG